jgi:hypothetical protein
MVAAGGWVCVFDCCNDREELPVGKLFYFGNKPINSIKLLLRRTLVRSEQL